MLAALAIAPMIAPQIGGWFSGSFDWHAIFFALAIGGVTARGARGAHLGRRSRPSGARPVGCAASCAVFASSSQTPGTRLPVFVTCATFAGQFAYIGDSPFVLIDGFHVSPRAYAYLLSAAPRSR